MKTLRVLCLAALCGISGCVRHVAVPPPYSPTATAPPPSPPPGPDGSAAPIGTGLVSGTVADSSGAVVPGTLVTVYGPGVQHTVRTDGSGHYVVPGLPWGTYSIMFSSSGFAVQKRSVVVSAAASAQANVVLSPGGASTVEAGGPAEPGATIKGFPVNPPLASAWAPLSHLVPASGHPTLERLRQNIVQGSRSGGIRDQRLLLISRRFCAGYED